MDNKRFLWTPLTLPLVCIIVGVQGIFLMSLYPLGTNRWEGQLVMIASIFIRLQGMTLLSLYPLETKGWDVYPLETKEWDVFPNTAWTVYGNAGHVWTIFSISIRSFTIAAGIDGLIIS